MSSAVRGDRGENNHWSCYGTACSLLQLLIVTQEWSCGLDGVGGIPLFLGDACRDNAQILSETYNSVTFTGRRLFVLQFRTKNLMTARVSMLLKSRASPTMLLFSLCNEKSCNSAHEQTPLSSDTIDSARRHREVIRAKDLSAPPRTDSGLIQTSPPGRYRTTR
jgi:hypothetical protein